MSSSSGTGSPGKTWTDGLNDQWNDFKQSPWHFMASHAMDAQTGGLHKQNDDGSITEGSQMHFWDEIVGAISGRNKARVENYETDKQLKAAEAKQQTDLLDNQMKAYRTDVAASQAAAGITATARARAKASQQQSDSLLGATGSPAYLGQS